MPVDIYSPTLDTVEQVRDWIFAMEAAGVGHHPDDRADTLISAATGKAVFTEEQAEKINAAWERAFAVCGLAFVDIYGIALDAFHAAEGQGQ